MFWGGALTGVALPTKDAVNSVLNKQKIRESGGNGSAAKAYEEYGYGADGFGDERTTKVENGQGQTTIQSALSTVRAQWGKEKIGKGLETGFKSWLEKKNICKNGSSNSCYVGKIEFIDNKDQTLFGRVPIKDGNDLKNVYLKWVKCTQNANKANAVGLAKFKKQNGNSGSQSSQTSTQRSGTGCTQDGQLKK